MYATPSLRGVKMCSDLAREREKRAEMTRSLANGER